MSSKFELLHRRNGAQAQDGVQGSVYEGHQNGWIKLGQNVQQQGKKV